MKCSRCGTLENKHTKDCYEAMILGRALGIEEIPAAAPLAVTTFAQGERDRLYAMVEDRNQQIDDLRRQLAEVTGKLTIEDFRKAAADVVEPEPEQPASEGWAEPLRESVPQEPSLADAERPYGYVAREPESKEQPTPAEEPAPEPAPAPASYQPTGRMKTPTQAVDIWLNEEAVATNDADARIVVATSPVPYAAWAADKPDMPDEVAPITIAKALKVRGYKRRAPGINGRQYPAYYGVRLRHPEPEPDGSIRQTRPDEEVAIVERFVTARTRPSEDPQALVPVADMYASFQRWCERTGQTDIGRDGFSTCMQQLGAYEKGVPWSGPGKKAFGYLGAELTPEPLAGTKPNEVPDNQTIRKAIAAAREAARTAREEREAAEAKAAEPPPTIYRVKGQPKPEPKADNNGWGKTFDTDGVEVSELTVEDVLAEHAEVEPRGGYSGPRPSPGDKLDGESRDLINAILNLDEGWSFIPSEGKQSHTFVVAPDGSRFRQASSFGNRAGRTGNNRELRRYLVKKGMLPTVAAPFSQLTSASTAKAKAPKPKPKPKPKPSTVKVVRSKETRLAGEERIAVPAEPDAAPLTEEEMDKNLFDLWVDVRSGYDGPFTYHPDVEALHGLDRDGITDAVRHPERCEVRPESKSKGYPVIKFARGDVNVIMGYRDRSSPAVIRAEWGWLLGHSQYEVDRHGGGGSKTSTGLPNTYAQLAGRLRTIGADVKPNDDGKTALVTYKEQELGLVTKERCPRSTVHSDWNRITRKIHAIDRRELAAV